MGDKIKISEEEKELRRSLKLPLSKPLRYMKRNQTGNGYSETPVTSFEIVDTYGESQTHSLSVVLDTGEQLRILAPFFSQMQKPNFEKLVEPPEEESEN